MALLPYIAFALIAPCSAQIVASASASASTSYQEIIVTTILLPSALFSPAPLKQNFTGLLSITGSTTFYNVYPNYLNNYTNFAPASITHYGWFGYPFSASAAGTQYVWKNLTVNCPPTTTPAGTATCTTTSTNLDNTNPPFYHTLAESSFYKVLLFNQNTTEQTPRLTPTLLKVGLGLGAPLALCLCVLLVLLIYRHREHKQLSRLKHTGMQVLMGPAPVGGETKLEPLVPDGEGGFTGFAAFHDGTVGGLGEGAGRGYGVGASEVAAAATNELNGLGKAGRRELA